MGARPAPAVRKSRPTRPNGRKVGTRGTENAPDPDCGTGQKRHWVAPPGSTVKSAVAVRNARRYTCHGGGPADGALKSAVRAVPLSSTRAGQPSAAHREAIAATVAGSVTLLASPSTTRSNSWVATLRVQRGSRAMLRAFRVRFPVSNQNFPLTQRAPIPVTCGLPSLLIVANQQLCRSGPPVLGASVRP